MTQNLCLLFQQRESGCTEAKWKHHVSEWYCSAARGLQCLFCFHGNPPLTLSTTSSGDTAPLLTLNKKKNTPQLSRSEAVTWASCLEGEINPGSGDWSLLYCKGDEVKRQLAHRLCQRPLICYCHDETLSQVKRYGLLDTSYLMSPMVHVTIVSIHLSLLKPECTSGTTPLPL